MNDNSKPQAAQKATYCTGLEVRRNENTNKRVRKLHECDRGSDGKHDNKMMQQKEHQQQQQRDINVETRVPGRYMMLCVKEGRYH